MYADQVEFGFSFGIVGLLTPDLCAGVQKFPAAPGVFYMADLCLPVDLNVCDESVGTIQKPTGDDIGITHGDHLCF